MHFGPSLKSILDGLAVVATVRDVGALPLTLD